LSTSLGITMDDKERIIARYISQEIAASGIAGWDHGSLVYENVGTEYLIEVKVFRLGGKTRLREPAIEEGYN